MRFSSASDPHHAPLTRRVVAPAAHAQRLITSRITARGAWKAGLCVRGPPGWLTDTEEIAPLGISPYRGLAEPSIFVPSGFSISTHHIVFSGSGSGANAWMS